MADSGLDWLQDLGGREKEKHTLRAAEAIHLALDFHMSGYNFHSLGERKEGTLFRQQKQFTLHFALDCNMSCYNFHFIDWKMQDISSSSSR
jgi:hypothetical protein